jgi:glutamate carboxypeptidase
VPALLDHLAGQVEAFLRDLAEIVAVDSGSGNAAGVTAVGDWCAGRLADLGFEVERVPCRAQRQHMGDAVVARLRTRSTGPRVLLLAHLDTVFPVGEAARRPLSIVDGRAMGPGASDDKAGILTAIHAVAALQAVRAPLPSEIVVLLMPDEEIGSPGGRPLLEDVATGCDVVLALECARENGDLVSARSGVGDAVVTLHGRAAHAGIEPERGVHALLAAAELTLALQRLNRPEASVTVNVGVIQGGTRPNVVPDRARLEVDVRATTVAAFEAARRAVEEAVASVSNNGVTSSVAWREVTPPMETTPQWLLELAAGAGAAVGVEVAHAATGGVGDANVTAGMGIPTLDGLGPIGGNDHSPAEYLEVASIAPRVAMLATLVSMLATPAARPD